MAINIIRDEALTESALLQVIDNKDDIAVLSGLKAKLDTAGKTIDDVVDGFKFEDFTLEQLAQLKGENGKDFKYEDFTPEQLNLLKFDKSKDTFTSKTRLPILNPNLELLTTDFIPNPDNDFSIIVCFETKPTLKMYNLFGIEDAGANKRISIGTSSNGSQMYVRVGSYMVGKPRPFGKRIVQIDYSSKNKKVTIIIDGKIEANNVSCILEQGTTPFCVGARLNSALLPVNIELFESNIYYIDIHDNYIPTPKPLYNQLLKIDPLCKLVAHRGYLSKVPENTISAFTYAVNNGSKILEADAHVTLDGEIVLCHDETIDRTSNGTGKIKEITFSSLSSFDFGSKYSLAFKDEKIPTLDQFCSIAYINSCQIFLEVKGYRSTADISIIVDIIKKHKLFSSCIFQSSSLGTLNEIFRLDSTAKLGYVSTSGIDPVQMKPNSVSIISWAWLLLNPDYVQINKDNGHSLAVWTINDSLNFSYARDLGVDYVISNNPFLIAE